MLYLKKYQKFIEARLSDILNLKVKNDSDISNLMKKDVEKDFDIDRKLLKYVTLSSRVSNKKVRFKIDYNDSAQHSLIKRIRERTSFKSVEEFNSMLKMAIDQVFPDSVGELITSTGRYSMIFEEYNFCVIFYIDLRKYMSGKYEIYVVTILPRTQTFGTIYDFYIE